MFQMDWFNHHPGIQFSCSDSKSVHGRLYFVLSLNGKVQMHLVQPPIYHWSVPWFLGCSQGSSGTGRTRGPGPRFPEGWKRRKYLDPKAPCFWGNFRGVKTSIFLIFQGPKIVCQPPQLFFGKDFENDPDFLGRKVSYFSFLAGVLELQPPLIYFWFLGTLLCFGYTMMTEERRMKNDTLVLRSLASDGMDSSVFLETYRCCHAVVYGGKNSPSQTNFRSYPTTASSGDVTFRLSVMWLKPGACGNWYKASNFWDLIT